jgi:hypothetical protein
MKALGALAFVLLVLVYAVDPIEARYRVYIASTK